MSKPKDGGPAFPEVFSEFDAAGGMKLRQYYAAHAPVYPFALPDINPAIDDDPAAKIAACIAAWNFAYADAMIFEGDK